MEEAKRCTECAFINYCNHKVKDAETCRNYTAVTKEPDKNRNPDVDYMIGYQL